MKEEFEVAINSGVSLEASAFIEKVLSGAIIFPYEWAQRNAMILKAIREEEIQASE